MPNLLVVHKIKFKYKDTTHNAIARKFTTKGHHWYLITIGDRPNFVVAPNIANHQNIWFQEIIPGEIIHPPEFIQAIGSGLEAVDII